MRTLTLVTCVAFSMLIPCGSLFAQAPAGRFDHSQSWQPEIIVRSGVPAEFLDAAQIEQSSQLVPEYQPVAVRGIAVVPQPYGPNQGELRASPIESSPPILIFPKGQLDWRPLVMDAPQAVQLVQNAAPTLAPAFPPQEIPAQPPAPDKERELAVRRMELLQRPLQGIMLSEVDPLAGPKPNLADEANRADPMLIPAGGWPNTRPSRYPVSFQHQPLYFEQPNLERCGVGHGFCEPIASAGTFIGNTVVLPFKMIANPPCTCVETLGDCPTCHRWTFSQLLWKLDCE